MKINTYRLLLISNNSKIKVIRPIHLDLIVKQFFLLLNNKYDASYVDRYYFFAYLFLVEALGNIKF